MQQLPKHEVLAKMREIGLVPVLRADSEEQAIGLASAIADGGVTVLEITMTVPGATSIAMPPCRKAPLSATTDSARPRRRAPAAGWKNGCCPSPRPARRSPTSR